MYFSPNGCCAVAWDFQKLRAAALGGYPIQTGTASSPKLLNWLAVQPAGTNGPRVYEQQGLFSLYVHSHSNNKFAPSSIFFGRQVMSGVDTTARYGQHQVVQAELALLREALKDPVNHKFVLLCGRTLPM